MREKRVFISHGHNEPIKLKLRNFIKERLGFEPVILAEQPDEGLTVIEKLERCGKDCDFALIVLTADDQTMDGGLRARQNVIHELGYFHGILGRKRVLLLKEEVVELFSNISGLIYKEFSRETIEAVFEDVRVALEVGDFSEHAVAVPIESDCGYTDRDWITAAIVGPEHAEVRLKKLASRFTTVHTGSGPASLEQIVGTVQSDIDDLLKKHESGGHTSETRLDACLAKVVADILDRELTNFQWNVSERPNDEPSAVFKDTVKAFVQSERTEWKK